jgi:hypothetical protein
MMAKLELQRLRRVAVRISFRFTLLCLGFVGTALTFNPEAGAAALYFDRSAFLSDSKITTTTAIDFDSFVVGTDLTGQTVSGVTFNADAGNFLSVIDASAGIRYPMSASSGTRVLSPGGANPGFESDGLEFIFTDPVTAAGIDVVFDVPDGASYVGVTFYDALNHVLEYNGTIPAPNGLPGYQFVGFVADSATISRVVFSEYDPTAMDDNVAYDSLVFSPAVAPEPSALLLLCCGLVGMSSTSRRKYTSSRKE